MDLFYLMGSGGRPDPISYNPPMTPEQTVLLKKYAEAVLAAPAHFHLTSDRNFETFWERHVADAIQLHKFIPPQKDHETRVLDVGSGNGIPGIPIAIIEPTWTVELLDSDNKKCLFLDTFVKNNAIINVHIHATRAELFAKGQNRSSYQVVFARALSKIRVALELTAAQVAIGGLLIVPHGTSWQNDLADLAILEQLGLSKPEIHAYNLGNNEYFALIFSKVTETNAKYPRANGIPSKRPL
jgi:16S rRNA (guanine527-N7)-methyltransferase